MKKFLYFFLLCVCLNYTYLYGMADENKALQLLQQGKNDEAIQLLSTLSDKGSISATYYLFSLYYQDDNLLANIEKAIFWSKKLLTQIATKKEFSKNEVTLISNFYTNLCKFYDDFVVSNLRSYENFTLTANYCLRAVKQTNNPIIYLKVARIYEMGQGVDVDYDKAFAFYQRLSLYKWPEGFLGLSRLYLRGHGVEKNIEQAFENALIAARTGYYSGKYMIADFYWRGIGTEKNFQEAFFWSGSFLQDTNHTSISENPIKKMYMLMIYNKSSAHLSADEREIILRKILLWTPDLDR
ncbi:MAG: sel1 repeat family protein [Alphaproteobacteria bacterium]|nr:sel1 repeat family protein [Alphaproteobacteria bacterium]